MSPHDKRIHTAHKLCIGWNIAHRTIITNTNLREWIFWCAVFKVLINQGKFGHRLLLFIQNFINLLLQSTPFFVGFIGNWLTCFVNIYPFATHFHFGNAIFKSTGIVKI